MTIEDDSIAAQLEARNDKRGTSSGGGSIQRGDPRLSKLIAWLLGALGTVSLALGGVAVGTLVGLRDDVRDLKSTVNFNIQANLDRSARTDAQIAELQNQVRELTQQVYVLEGKILRGIQEGRDVVHGR